MLVVEIVLMLCVPVVAVARSGDDDVTVVLTVPDAVMAAAYINGAGTTYLLPLSLVAAILTERCYLLL